EDSRPPLSRPARFVRRVHEIRRNRTTESMKTTRIAAAFIAAAFLALHIATAQAATSAAPAASPEFEKMKSLVGAWTGVTDIGNGPTPIRLEYRLLAGGTVLEERAFPGTPMEMVTMYYDRNGKLALTHYCVLGNRPGMVLKSADSKTFTFEFDPLCGI